MKILVKSPLEGSRTAKQIFDTILTERGLEVGGAREEFLSPKRPTLDSLIIESGLDREKLASIKLLLDDHLSKGSDICVFGDYDADGITATSILWLSLIKYCGKGKSRILPFLPDRVKHGYGLSVAAIADMFDGDGFKTTSYPDFSPKLVITVDNGIVATEAADSLLSRGIDLVITDHHAPGDTLPGAKEILHTTSTSGAGVAWILSLFLLPNNDFSYSLIDLATIGIVADMMPLHGLNRSIVVHGLEMLRITTRPGLVALYVAAKIERESISTYTIGFGIAPRINAAGRLYDPYDALRLLCSTNPTTAKNLADKINSHNQDRQVLTELAISTLKVDGFSHKIAVIIGDYHEGIVGLIAGKITELTHKPAIAMSDHGSFLKASARSVTGVNITELLRSLRVPFLSLGGHSQAAGFSIEKSHQDEFLSELYELADSTIIDEFLEPITNVDMEITSNQITLDLAKMMKELEPFGMGNPKPKFLLKDVSVLEDRKMGATGKHRKLTVESEHGTIPILLFNTKEPYPLKHLKLVIGTVDINIWNNRESVQFVGNYVES